MKPVDSHAPAQVDAASGRADVRLMELVVRGEPAAERNLVFRLMERVRRATRALIGNTADADDATQICMLEILKSARNYRGEGSIESWSDRIVVRTTLRYAKSSARKLSRLDPEADPDGIARSTEDALEETLPRSVRHYLEQLPEPRRTAIVLRHVLGHSIDEIAEITGVSRNTVKDRLLTARRDFRKLVRRDRAIGSTSSRRTA